MLILSRLRLNVNPSPGQRPDSGRQIQKGPPLLLATPASHDQFLLERSSIMLEHGDLVAHALQDAAHALDVQRVVDAGLGIAHGGQKADVVVDPDGLDGFNSGHVLFHCVGGGQGGVPVCF